VRVRSSSSAERPGTLNVEVTSWDPAETRGAIDLGIAMVQGCSEGWSIRVGELSAASLLRWLKSGRPPSSSIAYQGDSASRSKSISRTTPGCSNLASERVSRTSARIAEVPDDAPARRKVLTATDSPVSTCSAR
jgi:hypothetical protein